MKFQIILITMMFLVSSSNTFRRKRQVIFPDSDLWKKIMSSSAAENPDLSPDTNENLYLSTETNENMDLSTKTNKNPDFSPSKINENPGLLHREEDRGLVGHFYDMKNRFWAVGCGLGWAVE